MNEIWPLSILFRLIYVASNFDSVYFRLALSLGLFFLFWFCYTFFFGSLMFSTIIKFLLVIIYYTYINEAAHDKTYNKTCSTSEYSDQPAYPHSLIKSSLIACAFCSLLAIQREVTENPCHTGLMYNLIWVLAGHTGLIVGFAMRWLILEQEKQPHSKQLQSATKSKHHKNPKHVDRIPPMRYNHCFLS